MAATVRSRTSVEMPWLMIWKKPNSAEARLIWSTTEERSPEREMTGIEWEPDGLEDLRSEIVSVGWMKIRGTVVMPESTRPLTPILDSSNCLTSLARS